MRTTWEILELSIYESGNYMRETEHLKRKLAPYSIVLSCITSLQLTQKWLYSLEYLNILQCTNYQIKYAAQR